MYDETREKTLVKLSGNNNKNLSSWQQQVYIPTTRSLTRTRPPSNAQKPVLPSCVANLSTKTLMTNIFVCGHCYSVPAVGHVLYTSMPLPSFSFSLFTMPVSVLCRRYLHVVLILLWDLLSFGFLTFSDVLLPAGSRRWRLHPTTTINDNKNNNNTSEIFWL